MTLFLNAFRPYLGLGLGLDHQSFIWFRAFFKVYVFGNSKLIKPLHKGMAETDISHEFRREPGFSRLVFAVFDPDSSHMLHQYLTNISSRKLLILPQRAAHRHKHIITHMFWSTVDKRHKILTIPFGITSKTTPRTKQQGLSNEEPIFIIKINK